MRSRTAILGMLPQAEIIQDVARMHLNEHRLEVLREARKVVASERLEGFLDSEGARYNHGVDDAVMALTKLIREES